MDANNKFKGGQLGFNLGVGLDQDVITGESVLGKAAFGTNPSGHLSTAIFESKAAIAGDVEGDINAIITSQYGEKATKTDTPLKPFEKIGAAQEAGNIMEEGAFGSDAGFAKQFSDAKTSENQANMSI